MSSDMTFDEQSMFAKDSEELKLPIYETSDGQKVLVNPGSKAPSNLIKVAGRRKTKKSKRRAKKRSLLKSRKIR